MSLPLVLLGLALGSPAVASDHLVLDSEQGLPQNHVLSLAQTADGFLWIGTGGGLARYDGQDIERVGADVLPYANIDDLYVDSRDRLWISGRWGVARYEQGEVHLLDLPTHSDSTSMYYVHEDERGTVRILHGSTVVQPQGQGWRTETSPDACSLSRPQQRSPYLLCDREPYVLDDQGLRPVAFQDPPGESDVIAVDDNGLMWTTGPDGVLRFRRGPGGRWALASRVAGLPRRPNLQWASPTEMTLSDGRGRLYSRSGDDFTLLAQVDRRVLTTLRGREGELWVGTAGAGLVRVEAPQSVHTLVDGLPDPLVWSLLSDGAGHVWAGTERGLVELDADGSHVVPMAAEEDPERPALHSLAREPDGTLWASGQTGLWRYADGELQREAVAIAGRGQILRDHTGALWVGASTAVYRNQGDGFEEVAFPFPLELRYPVTGMMLEDPQQRLWIATSGGLVLREGEQWRLLTEDEGLAGKHAWGLFLQDDGSLWVTFRDGGLSRLRGDRIDSIGPDRGLPPERIHAIAQDGSGAFWLSSDVGLWRIPEAELTAAAEDPTATVSPRRFGTADGMTSVECNSGIPPVLSTDDGGLWFPTMKGIAQVDPDTLPPPAPVTPTLRGLQVDFADVELGDEVTLPPGARSLAVSYTAPSLMDAAGVRFRYRLDGYDQDWVEAGDRRVAIYTNLPPDSYRFELQAAPREGDWSPQAAGLALVVQPTWSQTWWFRGGILLLGLGLGLAVHRARVQRIRGEELEGQIVARTAELEASRTQTQAQAEQLADQAAALVELEAQKSRFFANVSHELRTPLTLVLGPLQQLRERGADPELDAAMRAARRLQRLIDELLDLTRLRTGHLPLRPETCEVAATVRPVVDALRPVARAAGVTLELQAEPFEARIDPEYLHKIVDNLVGNALRHTPLGGCVTISLSRTPGAVLLRVADTGPGIPAAVLPHVFERGYQSDGAGTAGIGLALVRDLAERHGGGVDVDSPPDQGACFEVRLAEPGQAALPSAPASTGGSTVLVVEDDDEMRAWLVRLLTPQHQVHQAGTGEAGLALATDLVPDLVVSDVMMPGISGIELCRRLEADPRTSHVPVLLLTAHGSTDRRVEGLQAGAEAWLAKPFEPRILRARIDNLIAGRDRLQAELRRRILAEPETVEVPTAEDAFLASVRSSIDEHLGDGDFGVAELARAVGMSRRQLSRKLSALIGSSPSALLRELRLGRARQLLEQRSGTVSEIAYQVGFNTPSRFTEQYRAAYGETPSQTLASVDTTTEA